MVDYEAWIAEHFPTPESAYGRCADATEAMQIAFPELRRVRGYFICAAWGERQHWWLVAPDDTIVDPTAVQFPSDGFYVPWPEGAMEPTGKCPNCGEPVYDSGTVCSDACADAYARYCMDPR